MRIQHTGRLQITEYGIWWYFPINPIKYSIELFNQQGMIRSISDMKGEKKTEGFV